MIDEEQLELEREELADINEKGFLTRFSYYAMRSGPGWLQGAITLGGGSLAGALYLGIISGYGMMWLQPLAMVCGVIMLLAIAYVTLSTGERPFGLINRNISPALGWAWLIATLMANIVWCMPQFALGVAAVQQNLMAPEEVATSTVEPGADGQEGADAAAVAVQAVPKTAAELAAAKAAETRSTWIICISLFTIALIVNFFYGSGGAGIALFEKILKLMVAIVVISFFAVVIVLSSKGELPWGEIVAGLKPNLSGLFNPFGTYQELIGSSSDAGHWKTTIAGSQRDKIIAAFATAVGINMTFLLPYSLLRKGWGKEHRPMAKVDLSIGLIVPFVLATGCVLLASASQFHGKTADVISAEGVVVPKMKNAYAKVFDKIPSVKADEEFKGFKDSLKGAEAELAELKEVVNADEAKLAAVQVSIAEFSGKVDEKRVALGMALPEADRKLAAMLANRDNNQLAAALEPLAGRFVAQSVFGVGVLGMALSTIIILMLINGFTLCEMLGTPNSRPVHLFGCVLAGVCGIAGPFLWKGDAKAALAIPTSVIGGALLPIAYYTFFLMMNSRRILGDNMPTGIKWLVGNLLMLTATAIATFASVWGLLGKATSSNDLEKYIGRGGLVVLAILFVVGTLGFLAKNTAGSDDWDE